MASKHLRVRQLHFENYDNILSKDLNCSWDKSGFWMKPYEKHIL